MKLDTGPLTRENVRQQYCSEWLKTEILRLMDDAMAWRKHIDDPETGNEYAIVTHWKAKMEAQGARMAALEAVAGAARAVHAADIHLAREVNEKSCSYPMWECDCVRRELTAALTSLDALDKG